MTQRSKQHGVKVKVDYVDEDLDEQKSLSETVYELHVTKFENSYSTLKRFKDFEMFRVSIGEGGMRLAKGFPENDDSNVEINGDDTANQLEVWFEDYLEEGTPLSAGQLDQLHHFIDYPRDANDWGITHKNVESVSKVINRNLLFTRHYQKDRKNVIKVGWLTMSTEQRTDKTTKAYVVLDKDMKIYASEEDYVGNRKPHHVIYLDLFWVALEDDIVQTTSQSASVETYRFSLRTGNLIIIFQSNMEEQIISWVKVLSKLHEM
jgi:hypothetical protein